MSTFYEPTSELYHYGVLGMKWGQRRADQKGGTYNYKSWGTKRNEWKTGLVNKKLAKGNLSARKEMSLNIRKAKYQRRTEISSDLDKREQEYSKPGSMLGTVAGRAAVGYLSNGTVTYKSKTNQQISAMMSRTKNKPVNEIGNSSTNEAIEKFVKSTATNLFVPGKSHTVKAVYMRKGEKQYINDKFGTRKERRQQLKKKG